MRIQKTRKLPSWACQKVVGGGRRWVRRVVRREEEEEEEEEEERGLACGLGLGLGLDEWVKGREGVVSEMD